MSELAAALLVGAATLLAAPRASRLGPAFLSRVPLRSTGQLVAAAGGAIVLVRLSVSPLLVVVVVGVVVAAGREVRRRRSHRLAVQRRNQVLTTCEGLAADLAAGLTPLQALRTMAQEWDELAPVFDAAAVGGDVPAAFRSVATLPGAGMLRVIASAWAVAHRSGAGLAGAVALAAETVRAERTTARVVATELSAATATARLLALLPLGILVLGRGMGGDPFGFLLTSIPGQLCLVVGLALAWSGAVWLERIADQVEQS